MSAYHRIILKLSGETLAPEDRAKGVYDERRILEVARVIEQLCARNVQTGIVLGGGNIWRGRFSECMDPVAADQMGMLSTILNALCLEEALTRIGVKARVFTVQEMHRFARLYTARDADEWLNAGGVALFAGGTGNPFFTTDSGAALRAAELKADAVFKGTTVKGVYDKDPRKFADARFIADATYVECIEKRLNVMDITAFDMCLTRNVPSIRVFSMDDLTNILRVADGEAIGSTIHK